MHKRKVLHMTMSAKMAVLLGGFLTLCASVSHAQFGLTAGAEYGLGVVSRFGQRVAFEVGAGFVPLVVFNLTVSTESKLYFPATAGVKISIATTKPEEEYRLGIKVGAAYNQIIKTGFGGGIDYEVSPSSGIVLSAGIMYFPEAQQSLTDKINQERNSNYITVVGESIAIQPFASISIIFGK
ncbi:MAG: hypothetical protein HYY49_05295 [Ignavibacteriales bacterium]|nr:hypothetical protein [Ignavibacteriales bacterium]